jgi:hypothetical protein
MGRGIALLFHDHSTRSRWVVSSTPRPHFTPGKEPVPIVQEAGWAPGPVWMGGKSRPHRDSIPDRPARSQSLYRMSYPAHILRSSDIDKTSGKWSCLCAYAWCSAFGVCVCVCVCVSHKCAGVMANNPLVLRNAEFNCSEDLFQSDAPWWITDIKYIHIHVIKKIYFHIDLNIILNTAIWSLRNPTNIFL